MSTVLLSTSTIKHIDIGSGNNLRLSGVEVLTDAFWRANDLPLEYFALSEPSVPTSDMLFLALSLGNLDRMHCIDLGRELSVGKEKNQEEGRKECRSFFDKPLGLLAEKIFVDNEQVYVKAFECLVKDYNTRSMKCLRLLNIQDFERLEDFFKRGRDETREAQTWRTERVNKVTRRDGRGDDKTYDRGLLVSPADAGKAMHILIQAAKLERTCELAARLFVECLGEDGQNGVLKTRLVLSGEYRGKDNDGNKDKMAMSPIMVEQVRDLWRCADLEPWPGVHDDLEHWVDVKEQMAVISTVRSNRRANSESLAEKASHDDDLELKSEDQEMKEIVMRWGKQKKKNCCSSILVTLNLFDPKAGQEKPANAALSKIALCLINRNYVKCEIKDSGGTMFEHIMAAQSVCKSDEAKMGMVYQSVHNLSALDVFPGEKDMLGLQVMTTAAQVGAVEVLSKLMKADGANVENVVGSRPGVDNLIHAHPLSVIGNPERLLTDEEYKIMIAFVTRCCDEWQVS